MPIDYRLLRADEIDAAADLWADYHPGLESDQHQAWRREFRSIPDHVAQTRVAVADDGTLLSIVHYWRQDIIGVGGARQHIGHVSHGFTQPYARRQGHAARLLEMTIAAMRRNGCQWSLLATTDEGRALYERYGWRPLLVRKTVCTLAGTRPPLSREYVVQAYDPVREPGGWADLAPIYDAYNAARPLTIIRDAAYWRNYALRVNYWLSSGRGAVLVARRAHEGDRLCGYVIAGFSAERGFLLAEWGVLPGEEGALQPLLAAVAARAGKPDETSWPSCLPRDAHVDAALAALCSRVDAQVDPDVMARALAPGVNEEALIALADAPGAVVWLLDDV